MYPKSDSSCFERTHCCVNEWLFAYYMRRYTFLASCALTYASHTVSVSDGQVGAVCGWCGVYDGEWICADNEKWLYSGKEGSNLQASNEIYMLREREKE